MSNYRRDIDIDCNYPSEFAADYKVVDIDAVKEIIDDIEIEVVSIREKLEDISGLDLIDEVVGELKALESKLY